MWQGMHQTKRLAWPLVTQLSWVIKRSASVDQTPTCASHDVSMNGTPFIHAANAHGRCWYCSQPVRRWHACGLSNLHKVPSHEWLSQELILHYLIPGYSHKTQYSWFSISTDSTLVNSVNPNSNACENPTMYVFNMHGNFPCHFSPQNNTTL